MNSFLNFFNAVVVMSCKACLQYYFVYLILWPVSVGIADDAGFKIWINNHLKSTRKSPSALFGFDQKCWRADSPNPRVTIGCLKQYIKAQCPETAVSYSSCLKKKKKEHLHLCAPECSVKNCESQNLYTLHNINLLLSEPTSNWYFFHKHHPVLQWP